MISSRHVPLPPPHMPVRPETHHHSPTITLAHAQSHPHGMCWLCSQVLHFTIEPRQRCYAARLSKTILSCIRRGASRHNRTHSRSQAHIQLLVHGHPMPRARPRQPWFPSSRSSDDRTTHHTSPDGFAQQRHRTHSTAAWLTRHLSRCQSHPPPPPRVRCRAGATPSIISPSPLSPLAGRLHTSPDGITQQRHRTHSTAA